MGIKFNQSLTKKKSFKIHLPQKKVKLQHIGQFFKGTTQKIPLFSKDTNIQLDHTNQKISRRATSKQRNTLVREHSIYEFSKQYPYNRSSLYEKDSVYTKQKGQKTIFPKISFVKKKHAKLHHGVAI